MYEVRYYTTARGDKPVEDFIAGLDKRSRVKVAQYISALKVEGPFLRRPFANKLHGKIYELRPKQARILYFFFVQHQIVFVHAFIKKTDKVPRDEIELADKRRLDWLTRNRVLGSGEY